MVKANDASSGFQGHSFWKAQEALLGIGEICRKEKKVCITFEAEVSDKKTY